MPKHKYSDAELAEFARQVDEVARRRREKEEAQKAKDEQYRQQVSKIEPYQPGARDHNSRFRSYLKGDNHG